MNEPSIDHQATYFTSTRDNLELLELFEQNIYIHASRIFAGIPKEQSCIFPAYFPASAAHGKIGKRAFLTPREDVYIATDGITQTASETDD